MCLSRIGRILSLPLMLDPFLGVSHSSLEAPPLKSLRTVQCMNPLHDLITLHVKSCMPPATSLFSTCPLCFNEVRTLPRVGTWEVFVNELFFAKEWNVYTSNDEHLQLLSIPEEVTPSLFEGLVWLGKGLWQESSPGSGTYFLYI